MKVKGKGQHTIYTVEKYSNTSVILTSIRNHKLSVVMESGVFRGAVKNRSLIIMSDKE
jgi:hypothetical protein